MRSPQKRYLTEVSPARGLYVLAMYGSAFLAPHMTGAPTWRRLPVALLPLPAIVWLMIALLRRLLGKDELEQRVELVAIAIAIAIATATVGLASLAWGLLDLDGLVPRLSPAYALPALR